jgi:hypothetical protein
MLVYDTLRCAYGVHVAVYKCSLWSHDRTVCTISGRSSSVSSLLLDLPSGSQYRATTWLAGSPSNPQNFSDGVRWNVSGLRIRLTSRLVNTNHRQLIVKLLRCAWRGYFLSTPDTNPYKGQHCKLIATQFPCWSLPRQTRQIQRHGARYPTSGATPALRTAVRKIQAAEQYTDPRLDFLADYVYELGENDLVRFGAEQ